MVRNGILKKYCDSFGWIGIKLIKSGVGQKEQEAPLSDQQTALFTGFGNNTNNNCLNNICFIWFTG